MKKKVNRLNIADAKIRFLNFSGEEGKYNNAGNRNFCVLLDDDIAEQLEKDGWNVRYLEPYEEGDDKIPYTQIRVSYKNVPPKIVMISSGGKTMLTEDTVHILDWADITHVDLVINPFHWEVGGKEGVKGYLKSMYVTIYEDEFAQKYRDVPDSAKQCVGDECE